MDIFIEISLILIITTAVATIFRIFKQPLVVGYLISGIIVGPYALNILQSGEQVELFSKLGIAVLLFIVGLSLNPDTIKETGKPALVTGIGQILFTSIVGFGIMRLLGYSNIIALYGSIALTFSSTIIILKLLSDKGDLNSLYGKVSIGFLLVQDIVATLLLIIVPLVGSATVSGNVGITFLKLAGFGIAASIVLYCIAKYLLPKFSDYLAKSSELLFIFAISWGLVLATIFYKIGFSIEIGALIAGVTLSASKYAYEISSRMRPLRDFFIVMFFVLLGAHLVIGSIGTIIVPAIILSLFVLIGNPIIVFFLMNMLGYKNKTSFMAGLTVAQISEFSLILMSLGLSLGHVDQNTVTLITLVGIITIAGSTYLVMYADTLYQVLQRVLEKISFSRSNSVEQHISNNNYETIIFGFGRAGLEFVQQAKNLNQNYVVVDYDPDVFVGARIKDVSYRFGDVEDVEFLQEIELVNANLVISTIPDMAINRLLLRTYRPGNKTGTIIVTCHDAKDVAELYATGATFVILPHYLGAYHATQMIQGFGANSNIFEKEKAIQMSQIEQHLQF
jgi:Kef-type K+ transport system membrane component KefB